MLFRGHLRYCTSSAAPSDHILGLRVTSRLIPFVTNRGPPGSDSAASDEDAAAAALVRGELLEEEQEAHRRSMAEAAEQDAAALVREELLEKEQEAPREHSNLAVAEQLVVPAALADEALPAEEQEALRRQAIKAACSSGFFGPLQSSRRSPSFTAKNPTKRARPSRAQVTFSEATPEVIPSSEEGGMWLA